MTEKNLVQTIHDTLWDEMKADDRVVVMGEDVGARGGVFRATAGFLDEFGEMRVIDTPLAESSIVGVAIGMAMQGMLPVAEIQFADFIHPAFDQLVSEAARIRYRSNGAFNVVLNAWSAGSCTPLSAKPAIAAMTIAATQASTKDFMIVLPQSVYSAGVAIGWRCESFGPVRAFSCSSQSA